MTPKQLGPQICITQCTVPWFKKFQTTYVNLTMYFTKCRGQIQGCLGAFNLNYCERPEPSGGQLEWDIIGSMAGRLRFAKMWPNRA